jgi:hypothetical protein
LKKALENIEDLISSAGSLITSVELPNIDSTYELLESFRTLEGKV